MKLLVGCPVAHRDWILDTWFDHVEAACDVAGVAPIYVFVLDLNDASWPIVRKRTGLGSIIVPQPNAKGDDTRIWNPSRYHTMVELRSLLLKAVRSEAPDVFLSLDSDILLHPQHLASMLGALDQFDAVGGKCYMTRSGTQHPSWAKLSRTGCLIRTDATGLFPVDVIMAIKAMTPAAYHVDYSFDLQGEDVGWSKACPAAGVHLGWDGRHTSKHVINHDLLDRDDPRVGF